MASNQVDIEFSQEKLPQGEISTPSLISFIHEKNWQVV